MNCRLCHLPEPADYCWDGQLFDCPMEKPPRGLDVPTLWRALCALRQELQDHQHSYLGPAGIAGKWCNTGPRRDTDSTAHAAYLKAQAEKKRPATAGEKEE